MKSYTLKKFLADLAILGLISLIVFILIHAAVIFVLLGAITA